MRSITIFFSDFPHTHTLHTTHNYGWAILCGGNNKIGRNQSIDTGWSSPDGAVYWADSKLGACRSQFGAGGIYDGMANRKWLSADGTF